MNGNKTQIEREKIGIKKGVLLSQGEIGSFQTFKKCNILKIRYLFFSKGGTFVAKRGGTFVANKQKKRKNPQTFGLGV